MKQKRAKAYRKQMSYYHLNFKFREPYELLIDEEIILDAIRTRYDLIEGFKRTVQGEIKPMITQCTMEALYRAKDQDAIDLARTFERRRCNHLPIRKHQNHENDHESDNKNENENDSKNNKKENVKSKEEEGPKSAFDCINSVVNINGKRQASIYSSYSKSRITADISKNSCSATDIHVKVSNDFRTHVEEYRGGKE